MQGRAGMLPPVRARTIRKIPGAIGRRAGAFRERFQERRFRPLLKVDPEAPPLLLSPHWDDAVLCCWGLLRERPELRVVNVCAGHPPAGTLTRWDMVTGATDSPARTRERAAEDRRALALAGIEPLDLNLLDAQYREPEPPYGLSTLDAAVSAAVPAASGVFAPAGIGSHPDHLVVRRYARMLLRAGMPVSLYADLPYCILHGWPHWVDGRDADPHRDVDAYWDSFLEAVSEMPPLRKGQVTRLDDEEARAKLAALEEYRTQLPALEPGGGELLRDPAIHRFEVHWVLRPG